MAAVSEGAAPASRYGVLLTQGTLFRTGLQLASVAAVLPFICAEVGAVWAAGLLYPAYNVGVVIGNFISPNILERSQHLKHLALAAATTLMSALMIANAVVALAGMRMLVTLVFLATSSATGVSRGISNIIIAEVISSKLPDRHRASMLLTQGAVGSVFAIVATLVVVPLLSDRAPMSGHIDLLWLGAAGLAAAGIVAVFVGPVQHHSSGESPRLHQTYRLGMRAIRTQRWYRRYAATQLMFVPVGLGITFFSLHASEQHADNVGSLHVLVIFSSAGLVIGSVMWQMVYRAHGLRGMMLASALVGCAAALVCILAEAWDDWKTVWAHGIVFLLATVAGQATFAASLSWINVYAARDRATLFAFTSVLAAITTTVLGGVLGGLAESTSAVWPVRIVLLLNLFAVFAAVWAPSRGTATAAAG